MLREFNHVNPQDDDEGKVFVDTRVSDLMYLPQYFLLIFLRRESYLFSLYLFYSYV